MGLDGMKILYDVSLRVFSEWRAEIPFPISIPSNADTDEIRRADTGAVLGKKKRKQGLDSESEA
jgi:hypothetical protein